MVIRWVAKWRSCSLSALAVALLKSCPRLPAVAPVVPGWWPPSCPRRRTATWWPPLPSWPLLTRRMRRARSKPSQECRQRRPPAFSTTWKRPYETGNQSASFKKSCCETRLSNIVWSSVCELYSSFICPMPARPLSSNDSWWAKKSISGGLHWRHSRPCYSISAKSKPWFSIFYDNNPARPAHPATNAAAFFDHDITYHHQNLLLPPNYLIPLQIQIISQKHTENKTHSESNEALCIIGGWGTNWKDEFRNLFLWTRIHDGNESQGMIFHLLWNL